MNKPKSAVRDKRAELGMTQAELAWAAQVPSMIVSHAETGRLKNEDMRRSLAGALGWSPIHLSEAIEETRLDRERLQLEEQRRYQESSSARRFIGRNELHECGPGLWVDRKVFSPDIKVVGMLRSVADQLEESRKGNQVFHLLLYPRSEGAVIVEIWGQKDLDTEEDS